MDEKQIDAAEKRLGVPFEEWARAAVTAFEENEDQYAEADDDVRRTWRSHRAKTKQWWQFWR